MDVSRLMILLKEAWSRARDEGVGVMEDFIGKPFTATTMSELNYLVNAPLESINRELREELGIELYVNTLHQIVGRAERRRLEKQKGKQVKTYNLTRSQLHNAVRQVTEEDLKRIKQEAMEDAINTAMALLLVLPMEVLMDHYWKKTYAKKIPEFTELVLQYYELWQNGELDMDEMKKDLWEYGGVRLEEREAE